MENEENKEEYDLLLLLEDFLRQARRMWLMGILIILLAAGGFTALRYTSFRPTYEAYASFTVRVANPLYTSVSSYNSKTAQVMADTFPSILGSDLLRDRVAKELGISSVPVFLVNAQAQSSILTLTVTDRDPQRAYDVLNAVIKCYPDVAEFVVGSTVLVLLDESGLPTEPVNHFGLRGSLMRGAVYGGILWLAIVALMIILKNTVHSEDQLRRIINAPCLGQVPTVKLSRKVPYPLVHRLKDSSGFAEAIQRIRLRVEKAMKEENKRVFLISSAIPGEGKTTISTNLAVSLAQKGKRVLLVDCDLRNPSVAKVLSSKAFPINNAASLLEFVKGKITAADLIQKTEVENLWLIPGGVGGKASYSALLSEERMAHLIQAARKQYDVVLLDTPPCSLLADAAEVAELAEAGIMVIRQDYAARDQILDGVQRLGDGSLPIVGCVLNGVRKSLTSGYGSYGYGYGGYGYGYGKSRK